MADLHKLASRVYLPEQREKRADDAAGIGRQPRYITKSNAALERAPDEQMIGTLFGEKPEHTRGEIGVVDQDLREGVGVNVEGEPRQVSGGKVRLPGGHEVAGG